MWCGKDKIRKNDGFGYVIWFVQKRKKRFCDVIWSKKRVMLCDLIPKEKGYVMWQNPPLRHPPYCPKQVFFPSSENGSASTTLIILRSNQRQLLRSCFLWERHRSCLCSKIFVSGELRTTTNEAEVLSNVRIHRRSESRWCLCSCPWSWLGSRY